MDILEKLFGGKDRVKIMRFFLFHPAGSFNLKEISERIDVEARSLARSLASFERIGFLKKAKARVNHRWGNGFALAEDFSYITSLRNLLISSSLLSDKEMIRRLRGTGKIKLLIVAGVFDGEQENRLDLFFVGDNMKDGVVKRAIRSLETEIGKELKYAYFETSEFLYRYDMYDKLIMDVLEFPHRKVINKLEI